MTYQPSREVFPADAVSLHEKMLRLRQEIIEAQEYRRKLEDAFDYHFANGHSPSYWKVEKQIVELRISEMESQLTALLDSYAD